jgi:hypothetical protein
MLAWYRRWRGSLRFPVALAEEIRIGKLDCVDE